MTDPLPLAELERLLAEATPGPWRAARLSVGWRIVDAHGFVLAADAWDVDAEPGVAEANMRLIVAARTALPALIERARVAEILASELAQQPCPSPTGYAGGYSVAECIGNGNCGCGNNAALSAARSAGLLPTESKR